MQEEATGVLRNLGQNHDNKIIIAAAGGIAPLVALLGSPSVAVRQTAMAALSGMNDDNIVTVVAAGALPHIVAMMNSPAVDVHSLAAISLGNLCVLLLTTCARGPEGVE